MMAWDTSQRGVPDMSEACFIALGAVRVDSDEDAHKGKEKRKKKCNWE